MLLNYSLTLSYSGELEKSGFIEMFPVQIQDYKVSTYP